MVEDRDSQHVGPTESIFVVVPHRPGPLISLETSRSQRERDDLDGLIDDLFPEVEERPGWFDAVLVVAGAGLLAWAWIGTPPGFVTALGLVSLALGCLLPARAAWRGVRQRREQRRREGLLEGGVPIDISSPQVAALVGAYKDLLGLTNPYGEGLDGSAISTAHGALLDVASLLKGRRPTSERELGYVEARGVAVTELVGALREVQPSSDPSGGDLSAVHPDALIEARHELDQITPFNSVARLEELIAETRIQRRGRS